jgi:phage tail-like protein
MASSDRVTPYLGFNFIVALATGGGTDIIGGFSDVSGLVTEITVAEYRTGNFTENHTHKYPSVYKTGDVTLKRGVVRNTDIHDWVEAVRTQGVAGKRDSVVITLLDETRQPVATWTLRSVMPLKWTGPTLAAKGGGDVAMEELVLSSEKIEFALV